MTQRGAPSPEPARLPTPTPLASFFILHCLRSYRRAQLLALELLKVLLENSGPTFRSSEKFTAAIRQVRENFTAVTVG